MKKVIFFSLSVLFIVSTPAYAKLALPMFTGKWFDHVLGVTNKGITSCHQTIYSYKNIAADSDPKGANAAAIFLANPPSFPGCEWSSVTFAGSKVLPITEDFGSYVDVEDLDWAEKVFQQVIDSHTGPVEASAYYRKCTDSYGIPHIVTTITQPQYTCSPQNRFGYDPDDKKYECSAAKVPDLGICNADIAFRDLNLPPLGSFGHMGLLYFDKAAIIAYPNKIIEAMDDDEHPHALSLDTFNGFFVTPYWGTKYGLSGYDYLDINTSQAIVDYGTDQQRCPVSEYTVTSLYQPCHDDPKYGRYQKYRCDSFVYDAYDKGGQIKIFPSFPLLATPSMFFDQFLHCRDRGTKCIPTEENIVSSYESLMNPFLNMDADVQEREIEDIFKQDTLDLSSKNGAIVISYLKNDKIDKSTKINFIWNLALKNETKKYVFSYLIDSLAELNPIELTDALIKTFKTENNLDNKKVLLNTLTDTAVQSHNASIDEADVNKIRALFQDVLAHEQNLDLLEGAVFRYVHIVESEQAKAEIDQVFLRQDIDGEKFKQRLIKIPGYYRYQLSMILSSSEMQKKYLKELLNEADDGNAIMLKNFNDDLYSYFEDLDFAQPKYGFDSSKLDDSIRPLLLQYLDQHKPQAFVPDHMPDFIIRTRDNNNYAWIATYMAVKAHSREEKNKMIADYIRYIDDLAYKSLLLSCATSAVYKQFTTEELTKIRDVLRAKREEKIAEMSERASKPNNVASPESIENNYRMMYIIGCEYKLNGILEKRIGNSNR